MYVYVHGGSMYVYVHWQCSMDTTPSAGHRKPCGCRRWPPPTHPAPNRPTHLFPPFRAHHTCRFSKTPAGVNYQILAEGKGPQAASTSCVLVDYVLRRANGYFIYSTVEGVSFQPTDVPTGPVKLKLVRAGWWLLLGG
jgi:hypothetical protein